MLTKFERAQEIKKLINRSKSIKLRIKLACIGLYLGNINNSWNYLNEDNTRTKILCYLECYDTPKLEEDYSHNKHYKYAWLFLSKMIQEHISDSSHDRIACMSKTCINFLGGTQSMLCQKLIY